MNQTPTKIFHQLRKRKSLAKTSASPVAGFSFRKRRWRFAITTSLACLCLWMIACWQQSQLVRSSFTTGYVLFGSIVFLTLFNLRKKFPMLPRLGSAALWMQCHIYVGLATFFIFGLHVAWRWPSGYFETLLATTYLIVAGSGLVGLVATRVIPQRLSALPEEVIYERIPWLRREIAFQARQLVLSDSNSTDLLARFYVNRLAGYLERPRDWFYAAYPTGKLRRQLITDIEELDRYLMDEQRQISRSLTELVIKKDDLDYHAVMQGRLKGWLFVHIGLTYSLLILMVLHLILVQAFRGGN